MFPSSTLHTDFARQLQHDRRTDVVIARRAPREGRTRVAAALLRPFHRTVRATTPAEATCPATVG